MVELARATGHRGAGFGLEYNKCFDLIQQKIVFRPAKEFGMDTGVLRAVRGMHTQLRRAFKFTGCLGAWPKAVSGILQGCLLSAIFISMRTTLWKKEIDMLNT